MHNSGHLLQFLEELIGFIESEYCFLIIGSKLQFFYHLFYFTSTTGRIVFYLNCLVIALSVLQE